MNIYFVTQQNQINIYVFDVCCCLPAAKIYINMANQKKRGIKLIKINGE